VRSGDVLAMATVQGATAEGPPRPAVAGENNKPLTDLFEPGSTNKVITIANAMERGLIGPSTPFDVPWEYWVNDFKPYHDDHQHPQERWSTTDILRESSNVGTIRIAQLMTDEQFAAGLRDFGLGEKTPIDFPGRPAPQLLEPDEYYKTGLASSAIGYSVAVTATHMVDVYATIARGGLSVPPRLVVGMIDADGNRTDAPVEAGTRAVSDATAATMNTMLREVVRAGTGACAAIAGYTVAGKTGTSRKLGPNGYIEGETLASFAGFVPAEDPRFAAIVVLDNPSTQYGARAAAPVFSEVLQFALTQYRVAPTDTGNDTQYAAAQAKAELDFNECTVPHGPALQQLLAEQAAEAAAQAQAQAQAAAEAATGTTVATGDGADANGTLPNVTAQSE
jgi:cell division protein FtsI (penicillin-binding protein 3)